jgi:hypothetical protein
MAHHTHNWNVFFVTLIICVILLLCIIIGVLLYKMLKEKPTTPPPAPKVRILPDRDNKVILIDGAFHRVDPGLYNKPYNYPGVVHRGPNLVDLNS